MATVAKIGGEVQDFEAAFKALPRNMRIFSLCLRSLYAENAVSSSSDKATHINKLRDETRRDAIVYVNGVLPLSTEVVRSIQEFFEYYEVLEYEEWKESLPDILDAVNGYQQCCAEVIKMHEDMMVPLKGRQDKAKIVVSELKDLRGELKKKSEEYERYAANAFAWASVLSFVPGVNVIAAPLLRYHGNSDLAVAVAEAKQVEINDVAIHVVSEALVPALAAFIDGLNAVAGFFNEQREELTTFKSSGGKATENGKLTHYKTMRNKAVEIKGSCKTFYAMIPGVRTDVRCIPEMPDDQNYVDKWLIKQQERIKKECYQQLPGMFKEMFKI